MFDAFREHFFESLGITLGIVFCVVVLVFGLIMLFSPSTVQSIETHDMANGVTCYTFNTNIDCLQVEK